MSLLKRFTFLTNATALEIPKPIATSSAADAPFVTQTPTADLVRLHELAELIEFVEGQVVIDDATLSHDAFFVLDGRLDIVRHGEIVAAVKPGWFAGEISIRDGRRRNATVVAGVNSRLYRVQRGNFETLYSTTPAIKAHIDETIKVRLLAA